jgi:hypothetical protein
VIVGLDLRKPKLSAEFNLNEVGIVNYLIGQKELKDIVNPNKFHLDVILSGPIRRILPINIDGGYG